jgi:hypothetical protein
VSKTQLPSERTRGWQIIPGLQGSPACSLICCERLCRRAVDELAADYEFLPKIDTMLNPSFAALAGFVEAVSSFSNEPSNPWSRTAEGSWVVLEVASTATDGTFFAYLEDVAPDGHLAYLDEGELRAARWMRLNVGIIRWAQPLAIPATMPNRLFPESLPN